MKTVWKGTLSFGLVNIYVELYTAIKEHSLGFKLLHDKCHTPIKYEKYCPKCDKKVAWENIVKGIPLNDGDYFIMTQENLKKLKPEKTDTISILEFVPTNSVPPIYFENHHYLLPSKLSEKAYALLQVALKEENKMALCWFVMRDKEYLCAVNSYKNGLLLSTLHFAQEILTLEKYEELKPALPNKSELKLANQLISKLSKTKFNVDKYKDEFVEKIRKKLKTQKPQKGVKKEKNSAKTKPSKATPSTLMDSLKASLRKSGTVVNGHAKASR